MTHKYLYFKFFLLSLFFISCNSNIEPDLSLSGTESSPIVYPPHITKPDNVTFDFNSDYSTLEMDFKPAPNYGDQGAEWARFNPKNFDNVEIRDSNLVLRATYDSSTDKFTTGAIFTKEVYGVGTRISVRAKIDKNIKGPFPAIWLSPFSWKPTDGSQKPSWPYSGEVDLFEFNDKRPEEAFQAIHFGKTDASPYSAVSKYIKSNVFEYHTYTCDILEDRVILYLDSSKTLEYIKKPGMSYPYDYITYNLVLDAALHRDWGNNIEEGDNRYHLPYELLIDWIHIENLDPKTGKPVQEN